jgi:hypothetical protein
MAGTPPSFQLTKSPKQRNFQVRATSSGSCSAHHISLAMVNIGCGGWPVRQASRSRPIVSANRAAWNTERVSKVTGLQARTVPSAATGVTASPCDETARVSIGSMRPSLTSRTAEATACQTMFASSSSRPGAGLWSAYSREARASALPVRSNATTLHAVVPTSMPSRLIAQPFNEPAVRPLMKYRCMKR